MGPLLWANKGREGLPCVPGGALYGWNVQLAYYGVSLPLSPPAQDSPLAGIYYNLPRRKRSKFENGLGYGTSMWDDYSSIYIVT